MKATVSALVIGALAISAWPVQSTADVIIPPDTYTVTGEFEYRSEYVFRGDKFGGHTVLPSLELRSQGLHFGDFYGGGTVITPLRGRGSPDDGTLNGNELNFYTGLDAELRPNVFLDIGGNFYVFPQMGTQDSVEPFVGLRAEEIGGTGLGVNGYFFWDIERSAVFEVGADYGIPLDPAGHTSLELSGTIGWVDETRILEEDQFYYGVSVTLPYRLSEVTTARVGGHFDGRFDGDGQAGRSTSREFLYWAASVDMAF